MAKDRAEQIRRHFADYTVYDFLASVTRHGRRILLLSVALAVVTFLVSMLLVSREYRTSATLLVAVEPYKKPDEPTDQQLDVPADPLSPKAYQELLKTPWLIRQVLEAVRERLDEDMILEKFMEQLSVGLVAQKERLTTVFTPLIELHVRGTDPQECRLIANTWADLATSASMRIKNAELIRFNRLIRDQYLVQSANVKEIEDEFERFEREADLAGKESLLEHLGKSNADSLTELVKVQVELAAARGQKEALERAAEAYYVNGQWVGSLDPMNISEKDVGPSALEMFRARNHLLAVQDRRAQVKADSQVMAKEILHENLAEEIKQVENRLDRTLDELAGEEARAAALERILAEDSPVVVVRKAITDEAIWQSLVGRGAIPENLRERALTSEEVNEAFGALREEYGKAVGEAKAKRAAAESGRRVLAQLHKRLNALDADLARHQEEVAALDVALEAVTDHYKGVYEYYTEVAVELSKARDMTHRYEKQVADLRAQMDANQDRLYQVGRDVGAGLVRRAQFERRIEAQKALYEEIARKNARAHMADLEKTGDLRVAFYAPEPERSFARQKQRNFTGAVFTLSLIAFAIYFAARDRMRSVSSG